VVGGCCLCALLLIALTMMFSRNARYLLQRAISSPTKAQVSRQSFATSVPKGAAAAQQAAPSHQQQQQQDLVRSAIEGLLEKQQFNHHEDDSDAIQQQHGIEDRELKTRVEEFEVRHALCLTDGS
jgi:Na+-transporting methylmalonyl-CoA/oxaloacetate decarboxylase gamma subunit